MPVNPIPNGYDRLIPYLCVSDAAAAIEWYKKAFGAEEFVRMPTPDGKVMHAEIKINQHFLFLSDSMQGARTAKEFGGSPASVMLYVEDVDKFFEKALGAGAKQLMPPTDMFWGDRFGRLEDPEGYQWAVATHKEDLSPEEMEKRMAAMA